MYLNLKSKFIIFVIKKFFFPKIYSYFCIDLLIVDLFKFEGPF